MGLSLMSSGDYTPPNPSPDRYRVIKTEIRGKYTLARVYYPGVTTYGGIKLLLFEGQFTPTELNGRKTLDPHFLKNKFGPIARFRPTKEGYRLARQIINNRYNQ